MNQIPLNTISPLEGRYAEQLTDIRNIFGEFNFMWLRLYIEIAWLTALSDVKQIKEIKPFSAAAKKYLLRLVDNFSAADYAAIKKIETTTKHDVKSVEYFLKKKLAAHQELKKYVEFVHFACTSDDINNLAYALILKLAKEEAIMPTLVKLERKILGLTKEHLKTAMLARTHGQPATPTTVGKEFLNFGYRLSRQIDYLSATPILAKFNGAVGNFNAHSVAYPEVPWQKVCQRFIESFACEYNPFTTQIEPHDYIVEYSNVLHRINTILIGFCQDIWHYISLNYFTQKSEQGEVGSSTMPHKINPIDFENAEGNLGVANALLQHFANKLPISRWQRDLSDSTVLRNLGVALGHTVLAYNSILHGLDKMAVNAEQIAADLDQHWEILAEAIQTVARRYGVAAPYEKLKALTRGQKITREILHDYINSLDLPTKEKQRLLALTPAKYLGVAAG